MARRELRIRVMDEGVEVVDPGLDVLGLIEAVDQKFTVRTAPLPCDLPPRLALTRVRGCGLSAGFLSTATAAQLWDAHARAVSSTGGPGDAARPGEATLLELKNELASRCLEHCGLCAHRCGVNRYRGERGVCGLGPEALVAEHFVHVAEEAPINPSLVVSLGGCGLRCRYCQQWPVLDVRRLDAEILSPALWSALDLVNARTLSFVGGNPDESLPAILRFLAAAPVGLALPVVWNCHAYASAEALDLLDGVVDIYVPDFKYFSDECARRLSGASCYPEVACDALLRMLDQGASVIVRLLVLPGHFDCCHAPVVRWLASLDNPRLQLSVRGQYCPDYRTEGERSPMGRRIGAEEVSRVVEAAITAGLSVLSA